MIRHSRVLARGLSAAAVLAALSPSGARAEIRREGQWPASDPVVSLDVDHVPRSEALSRLAKAAGWSLVVNAPKDDPVSLHIANQPAGKVLDLLLSDGHYVARRDDGLIAIAPASSAGLPPAPPAPPAPAVPPVPAVPPAPAVPAVPPVPPIPPVPPAPSVAADQADDDDGDPDRTVTGGSLRIEKGQTVHDVTVLGGTLEVWGTVTGDLAVLGGGATIHEGAHVHGDASVMGGSLDVESGASVDGDVSVLGGKLHRAEGAKIGGEVKDGVRKERAEARRQAREARRQAREEAHRESHQEEHAAHEKRHVEDSGPSIARKVADAVNGAALLFVFGAVLLALAPGRMDQLKLQIAARPMRTFATGVVGLLGGLAVFAAACVTIIGIPVAVVCLFAAVLATLAGVCSVLETVGAALLGHRTRNPYVHLAFGGLLFVVTGAIPHVGDLVNLAVFITAFGAVVATRAAGLLPAKLRGASPYRDAPVA